jgi:hypothetical protein
MLVTPPVNFSCADGVPTTETTGPTPRDEFVRKMPDSMPYGGQFMRAGEFDAYFKRVVEQGNDYDESLVTGLRRVIEADEHLIAKISITAKGRTTRQSTNIENAWVFDIVGGVKTAV